MPQKVFRLIILFTAISILKITPGDLSYLLNQGKTICPAYIGVGG